MYENIRFIEMIEALKRNHFQPYNFIEPASLIPLSTQKKTMRIMLENSFGQRPQPQHTKCKEPSSPYDLQKNEHRVTLTIFIPEISLKHLQLKIMPSYIELLPTESSTAANICIPLPCAVDAETTTYTYINGVLDIVIQRKKNKKLHMTG